MENMFYINGLDSRVLGLHLGDGAIGVLGNSIEMKSFIENESRLKAGTQVIVNNPLPAARDITLSFVIKGSNRTDVYNRMQTFRGILEAGDVAISVPAVSKEVFHLVYKRSQDAGFTYGGVCTAKVSIRFTEYDPTNRS